MPKIGTVDRIQRPLRLGTAHSAALPAFSTPWAKPRQIHLDICSGGGRLQRAQQQPVLFMCQSGRCTRSGHRGTAPEPHCALPCPKNPNARATAPLLPATSSKSGIF